MALEASKLGCVDQHCRCRWRRRQNGRISVLDNPMMKSWLMVVAVCLLFVQLPSRTEARRRNTGGDELRLLDDAAVNFRSGSGSGEDVGLYPKVFNLASMAGFEANATCGEDGPEYYCPLNERVMRNAQCGLCDSFSPDGSKRHPIENAIGSGAGGDGTMRWWQSPSLEMGDEYEFVTITIDLRQVFRVKYVIVKSAISPRPGIWALEKSLDGLQFTPWQYFAPSDLDCRNRFGVSVRPGTRPALYSDNEVICTSHYSKLEPLEGGEIHTDLVNGRPGAPGPTKDLVDFTKARYVRLRLQGILRRPEDTVRNGYEYYQTSELEEPARNKYFYSIKEISIGGQCLCHGHANECYSPNDSAETMQCKCQHNTCGIHCDECCPLYNNRPWVAGNHSSSNPCVSCQCHGHADSCHYDKNVEAQGLSLNADGVRQGGGVCDNCKHYTTGINCERCIDGFYRPSGVLPDETTPCVPCACNSHGSTGKCVSDDSEISEGVVPGQCECKEGFAGRQCNQCAVGYRNFPKCEPCPCNLAGTTNSKCEGSCVCKEHVVGRRCDSCAKGFFFLEKENPEGCSECFCYGVASECESYEMGVEYISYISSSSISKYKEQKASGEISTRDSYFGYDLDLAEDWRVTDISGMRSMRGTREGDRVTAIDEEVQKFFDYYYWEAPSAYLGSRITGYGGWLRFKISWVRARGDTSGAAIRGPDIVLSGAGYTIGFGKEMYLDGMAEIRCPLTERGWYHIPSGFGGAFTSSTELSQLKAVTRKEFMLVLGELERLLVRAKFSSIQVDGSIYEAVLVVGSEESRSTRRIKSVEKCRCPKGYAGLSCEKCDYGYRRVNYTLFEGECRWCDCNGHVQTCDAFTGVCGLCDHNTTGSRCQFCLPGFYGDATKGTPNDCKKCACPLADNSFNLSPTCELKGDGSGDYVCTACPTGYGGDHCERCADGYFGNPFEPGKGCRLCQCNGNADTSRPGMCNHVTGECINCLYNTGGPYCDICAEGYYGDALRRTCKQCGCSEYGAESNACDPKTGQCKCKPGYMGRMCDQCANPHGHPLAACRDCSCDPQGSTSDLCDPLTGECQCKEGVTGLKCDSCLDNFYGFGPEGCLKCSCNSYGSLGPSCGSMTGQCNCHPNVGGRACDRCERGFWNLKSGRGCEQCDCVLTGTEGGTCDQKTGACICREGVGGTRCDKCLPGYFGYSSRGCKKCDTCNSPGHLCDPDTGRCVCPPFTEGAMCERCQPGTYNLDPIRGCKSCQCTGAGAIKHRCNPLNGHCECVAGYGGPNCDRCDFGYYGYPNCRSCECNIDGTKAEACRGDTCQCDPNGQCPCKANVAGKQCCECRNGTFAMSATNPSGCTDCFCFDKADECAQAPFTWSAVKALGNEVRHLELESGHGYLTLNSTNGHRVVPSNYDDLIVGENYAKDEPLYWQLPREFLGDKVVSYNGFLRFRAEVRSQGQRYPQYLLSRKPLVHLQGNWKIKLEHFPTAAEIYGLQTVAVRFHESQWQVQNNPQLKVTREMMMVALQNLQHVFIRVSDSPTFRQASLRDVKWDVAVPSLAPSSLPEATGVERCICSKEYNGTSCQNPSRGYYRWRKPKFLESENILDLVGISLPCRCNGHAQYCDKETGGCINCGGNTMGLHCDICKPGYYGDPRVGPCRPCACPTLERNYAATCHADAYSGYVCNCKLGYAGRKCDKCDYGYYGDPMSSEGLCLACNCNRFGSSSDQCDLGTGQCPCRPGMFGRTCNICSRYPPKVMTEAGCTACDDGCAGALLEDLYYQGRLLLEANITSIIPAPWGRLSSIRNQTYYLRHRLEILEDMESILNGNYFDFDLEPFAKEVLSKAEGTLIDAEAAAAQAERKISDSTAAKALVMQLWEYIEKIVAALQSYAFENASDSLNIEYALREAERILKILQSRDLKPNTRAANEELRAAQRLLELVKAMLMENPAITNLRPRTDVLKSRLVDLKRHVDEVRRTNFNVGKKTKDNEAAMAVIKKALDDIYGLESLMKESHLKSEGILEKSRNLLQQARTYFYELTGLSISLMDIYGKCEKKEGIYARLLPKYRLEYVIPAQEHARTLQAISSKLSNQFNATREVAQYAVKAAEAYQTIVISIEEAEKAARAAKKASEEAYTIVFAPAAGASPVDLATKSLELSRKLLEEARTLVGSLAQLKRELQSEERRMESVEKTLFRVTEEVQKIHWSLDNQPTGLEERGRQIYENGRRGLATAIGAVDKAMNVSLWLDKLKVEISSSLAGQTASIIENEDLLNSIAVKIQSIKQKATNVTLTKTIVSQKCSDVGDQLMSLRQKIERARKAAAAIRRVSLNDVGGTCSRMYKTETAPSLVTSVEMTYSFNREHKESLLYYMPPDLNRDDFMAIEMVNGRKIRLAWNVGDKVKELINDTALLPNENGMPLDDRWYTIRATRIGGIGKLEVLPVIQDDNPEGLAKSNIRGSGRSDGQRMVLDTAAGGELWIGGAPAGQLNHVTTNAFVGCIHELFVNGEKIGLWNFRKEITPCGGCTEGATANVDDATFRFSNGAFAESELTNSAMTARYYTVSMHFRTYAKNAVLFFTGNKQGQYIMVALIGGKVVTEIYFGDNAVIRLATEKQHNHGEWTWVEMGRQLYRGKEEAILKAKGEEDKKGQTTAIGGNELNFGDDTKVYVGGVPPDFPRENWPDAVFDSYAGCMKDVSVMGQSVNPMQGAYFGVRTPCPDTEATSVSFDGSSVESAQARATILKRQDNGRAASGVKQYLGFSFRASAKAMESSFLLEAVGEGEKPIVTFVLTGGRVNCTVVAASGTSYYYYAKSDTPLSPWATHTLVLRRGRRKNLVLYLNETKVEGEDVPSNADWSVLDKLNEIVVGESVTSRRQQQQLLSRARSRSNTASAARSDSLGRFHGCIRDIVVDDEILTLNGALARNAILGNCIGAPDLGNMNPCRSAAAAAMFHGSGSGMGIPPVLDEPARKEIRSAASCASPYLATFSEAVSLGDSLHQESRIELPGVGERLSKDAARGFSISFQFRTNATEGLLLHSLTDAGQILAVYITEGHVQAVVSSGKKRGKVSILRSRTYVSDGRWHEASIEKKGRDAILRMGSTQMDRKKIIKKFHFSDSLFIGSVPEELKENISQIVYQPFHGCITGLRINKGPKIDLAEGKLLRVLNCYTNIESGAYFSGDAFAKTESPASLNRGFDAELSFRSAERHAVLLNIGKFHTSSEAGIRLSFIDDEVILRVKPTNGGKEKSVKQRLPTKFLVCDNDWHRIRLRVRVSRLSLQLDNLEEVTEDLASAMDFGNSTSKPEIYIGGSFFEEHEPLFKGCMRDFKLSGAVVPWAKMKSLSNVRINACPVNS